MYFFLFLIFSYLLGSIPFGFIIPKAKGIDIRKIGSKGTTATNVARALGWKWGVLSGALDVLKSVIPTYFSINYLENEWQIIPVALMPTVGHIFPVWLNFKGGRGASTFFGAAVMIVGLRFFLASFLIWILILYFSRVMSLTNLLFGWIFSFLLLLFYPCYFLFGFLGACLLTFALRENIKRLKEGKEPKVSFKW